jgi:ABC-2 type transport system ATP-binding protein
MSDSRWHLADAGIADDRCAVRLDGIRIEYDGKPAVINANLRVPFGEIFGLLGPNGAGKTSIFRVLASLLKPANGEAWLCGHEIQRSVSFIRGFITYMQDLAPMPGDLRAVEYLRFYAEAFGMRGRQRDARVDECLDLVSLQDHRKQFCDRLSLGLRQRLALAKAILHRPRVLILDEPASGLDPLSRVRLKEILKHEAARGASIIISSHVMAEIEGLCTSLGLIKEGVIIDAGPISRVLNKAEGTTATYQIDAPGAARALGEWLATRNRAVRPVAIVSGDLLTVEVVESDFSAEQLFQQLASSGLPVTGMRKLRRTVEDVVINLAQNPMPGN